MVTGDVSIGHTYFWRNIWWYFIKCTIVWWCYLFNPRFPTICFVINNLNNSFYNNKFVELQLRLLHDVFIFHAGVWIKIVSNHTLIYFYLFHNINIWKNIRFDAFSVAWSNEVFMLSSYFQVHWQLVVNKAGCILPTQPNQEWLYRHELKKQNKIILLKTIFVQFYTISYVFVH